MTDELNEPENVQEFQPVRVDAVAYPMGVSMTPTPNLEPEPEKEA